jgi:DNA excision repair protein ERCC-3
MGLSASPFREDGKTEYIFSLTGFPVGMEWDELVERGIVDEPTIKLYLYNTMRQKKADIDNIINNLGKTAIFCDSIEKGKKLSERMDIPFIHGETKDRMSKLENNRTFICSRVGDEGISLSDIDRVIEFDFHGSSRRQELQRMGRVMHGETKGEHIIMMTDKEYRKYGERLYSIEQKGFRIKTIRRS